MNNFRWLAPFTGRRRRFMGWSRRNNRGGMGMGMLFTLIGVGATAAWAGMTQRNNNDTNKEGGNNQALQNMLSTVQERMPKNQTAFSEELSPKTEKHEEK